MRGGTSNKRIMNIKSYLDRLIAGLKDAIVEITKGAIGIFIALVVAGEPKFGLHWWMIFLGVQAAYWLIVYLLQLAGCIIAAQQLNNRHDLFPPRCTSTTQQPDQVGHPCGALVAHIDAPPLRAVVRDSGEPIRQLGIGAEPHQTGDAVAATAPALLAGDDSRRRR
jgi:hypothetical protein